MSSVFVVQHVHTLADGSEDVKFVGVYSSRATAEAAVARLSQVAGFADATDGFSIDEYPLDRDHWTDGYVAGATTPQLASR
jgi:hypothetical protein